MHKKQIPEPIEEKRKVLYIVGEINESTTSDVLRELIETSWEKENITILEIYIVSEGGFLRDCFAVIDLVTRIKKDHKLTINTFGLGEIASAGFFLFLLGDNRYLFPSCRVFVHEHITINDEKTYGERLRADRTEEKEVYNNYLSFTAQRLNITMLKARKLLQKNKWLTKKEINSFKIKTVEA